MSMARSCAGSALAFLFLCPLSAGACTLPAWESVALQGASRDALLADGRIVRLAGITPADLTLTLKGGPARLSVLSRATDRWGRVAGVLAPGEGAWPESFAVALLKAGAAFAVPGELPAGCYEWALAAESEARAARRGLWSTNPVLQAMDVETLRAREGRFAIVAGTIRSVRQGRRQVFLNFGAFGGERFSVTVAVSRLDGFKAAGLDILSLRGRHVELRGVVGVGPSMELQSPEALVVLRRL